MLISCIHRRINVHLPLDENPLLLSSIPPTLLAFSVPSFHTFHRKLSSAVRWRKWVLSDMTFSTINYHCLYLSISFSSAGSWAPANAGRNGLGLIYFLLEILLQHLAPLSSFLQTKEKTLLLWTSSVFLFAWVCKYIDKQEIAIKLNMTFVVK